MPPPPGTPSGLVHPRSSSSAPPAPRPATIDLTAELDETPPKPRPNPATQPRSVLSFRAKHGPRQQQLAVAQAAARRQAEQAQPRAQPLALVQAHQPTPSASTSGAYSAFSIPASSSASTSGPTGLTAISQQFPFTPHKPSHNPAAAPAPMDPPRPVCLGLLSSLVLMLYPLKEFLHDPSGGDGTRPRAQTLPVRIRRFPPSGAPTGDPFGVVENKIGNSIGPLLGPVDSISGGTSVGGWRAWPELVSDDDEITETDGLGGHKIARRVPPLRQLYIECCVIRRGEKNPTMLPLQLLLFCRPDSIATIGAYLTRSGVVLEHPLSYDPALHLGCRYFNPHSLQPREAIDQLRQRLLGGPDFGTGNLLLGGREAPTYKAYEAHEQVDAVFKSLASGVDLDETEPSPMMVTRMYAHQKQALSFMLDRETPKEVTGEPSKAVHDSAERKKRIAEDEANLVSLWKKSRDRSGQHVGWINVVTGIEQLGIEPPEQCRGSLLADDMGLGKTISIIALIATTIEEAGKFGQSEPKPQVRKLVAQLDTQDKKPQKDSKTMAKKKDAALDRSKLIKMRSRATLIICPLSTVQNWESQIQEHVRGLSVCVYHGNGRTTDAKILADHDVVITTYSLLGYEYSRQNRSSSNEDQDSSDGGVEEVDAFGQPVAAAGEPSTSNQVAEGSSSSKRKKAPKRKRKGDGLPSPLQAIEWFRVVLDEAHMIKEHSTIQSRAACDLFAQRRACLTGTPLQNSLNDLFSLICFLRLEPFTDRVFWTTHIGTPAKMGDKLGVSRLKLIMRQLALRRTKQSVDKHGKPILSLPPKRDEIVYLELDEAEKKFYSAYHQRSKKTFLSHAKNDTLLKNYCSILQELLRLRQICAHMGLVLDAEPNGVGNGEADVTRAVELEGLTRANAIRLVGLMRETGIAQCTECGGELGQSISEGDLEDSGVPVTATGPPTKRLRKSNGKKRLIKSAASAIDESGEPKSAIITRCQHLFCMDCFRSEVCANWPEPQLNDQLQCSVCYQFISADKDVVEISDVEFRKEMSIRENSAQRSRTPNLAVTADVPAAVPDPSQNDCGVQAVASSAPYGHSTKVRHLIYDLLPFSQANPASQNYSPNDPMFDDSAADDPDQDYKAMKGLVVKSVVFSQWTKLLDKIGNALEEYKIEYGRLDGTMGREDRNRAMNDFKTNPKCEILLVSLRAGGVGLNLTCAQRVYLMERIDHGQEPFWNPAVENQAVDRVHRLGQTKPVRMVRYIISGSVEQNMLEIQKRKTELAKWVSFKSYLLGTGHNVLIHITIALGTKKHEFGADAK